MFRDNKPPTKKITVNYLVADGGLWRYVSRTDGR